MLLGVRTTKEWVTELADIFVIGHLFVFGLIFLPPVIASFIAYELIPGLHDDAGFTKAMFVLLPGWNLLMWLLKVRLYIFFLPAWILFGIIALIKAITNDY